MSTLPVDTTSDLPNGCTLEIKRENSNWFSYILRDPDGNVKSKASHWKKERSAKFWPAGHDMTARGNPIYSLDREDMERMMIAQADRE